MRRMTSLENPPESALAPHLAARARMLDFRVAGKPDTESLRGARRTQTSSSSICMGNVGLQKMFLGSTTERVLRETTVAVLVTRDRSTRRQNRKRCVERRAISKRSSALQTPVGQSHRDGLHSGGTLASDGNRAIP